ncbi:DUF1643 domain-containing protein [Propionigenium maris DSM 9537]|uniref:DUF1643 domain-containing protein n=1 Tax=Propionigenium maris DSM 9537 TaxID=1123000 RepID=A0A9W6GJP8_9FUSO|nr:DUF1643 domain-containing protein [Propionigenium maris]GLI56408.1 DUF1643 domain-containing protein [Propionigenium maris DSM 9537]
MVVEKTTLKTEAMFSENKKHRYILRKEWDKAKDRACVLMINPSDADGIVVDLTTQLVINNLSKLDYGSVDILNLYSMIGRLATRAETEEAKTENLKAIMQSCDKATKIILAYGAIGKSNKTVKERIDELLSSLEAYKDKVFYLTDKGGETLYHPLVPSVRLQWELVTYFK